MPVPHAPEQQEKLRPSTSTPDAAQPGIAMPAPTAEQTEYFRRLRESHVAYDPKVTIGGPRTPEHDVAE